MEVRVLFAASPNFATTNPLYREGGTNTERLNVILP
jgi:hypothetical protein